MSPTRVEAPCTTPHTPRSRSLHRRHHGEPPGRSHADEDAQVNAVTDEHRAALAEHARLLAEHEQLKRDNIRLAAERERNSRRILELDAEGREGAASIIQNAFRISQERRALAAEIRQYAVLWRQCQALGVDI